MKHKTVIDLRQGQKGTIKHFTDDQTAIKLLEMGCLLGNEIEFVRAAPFGNPIYVKSGTNLIALRKEEAMTMIVE